MLFLLCLPSACTQPAGVIFPPLAQPIQWPEPPEPPRIQYVGQLLTNKDLKPPRPMLESLAETIMGKRDAFGMLTPFALCTDDADRLFVADSNAQLVHVFDLKTRRYARWKATSAQPQFSQPVGIAWDPSGRLLVSDSIAGAIFTFDTNGNYTGQLGVGILSRPCGILVHPLTSRIYVADAGTHQIVVLNSTGQQLARIGQRGSEPGQFNFPTSLAMDHQGRLYVCDSLNFRIQQILPDMKTARQIGSKGDMPGYFASPKSLAIDSDDHLYVVDNQFESVQIFDSTGLLLLAFGEEGHGPGQFWLPNGIFIDGNNRVWIADCYNQRVQVFDYTAEKRP